MATITIQTSNTQSGAYDALLPLPYPFHCDSDSGRVGRQDFWQGSVYSVVGFQETLEDQTVSLFWRDAAQQPERMHGMFPIIVDQGGNLFTWTTPVSRTTIQEEN